MTPEKKPEGIEVTIKSSRANLFAFVTFFVSLLLFALPFVAIWGNEALIRGFRYFILDYTLLIPALIAGMLVHEFLHALTFAIYSRSGFKAIRFGINLKQLAPYVHCSEPLTVLQYGIGTIMPGLILGIIPAIISVFSGQVWWLWFGIFFTAGAAGDFLTLWYLRTLNVNTLVKDHSDHLGFIILKNLNSV